MDFASGMVAIAEPILSWALSKGEKIKASKEDFQKVNSAYKEELRNNWAFLKKVALEKIDTKDINNPSIKDFAARLQTKATAQLLVSLYNLSETPEKAVKVLKNKSLTKEEKEEAKKLVKTIISVHESTKELQMFTTLTEAERKILKGFYVRKRIKNIQEKTRYIYQQIIVKKEPEDFLRYGGQPVKPS